MWLDKRYHSLDYALKAQYGHKLYKISLNGGFTCPNRDGTLDNRGCIFCSRGGSGDFAAPAHLSITEQIETGKQALIHKPAHAGYIAYFQAFTNTYGPIDFLRQQFMEAISHPDVVILSIATRPDCLGSEVIDLLIELNQIKPVWIELGLQTIHAASAQFIRRGYPLSVFDQAVERLHQAGITIIVHIILGLPGESHNDMLETVHYVTRLPIHGIKLQLLHILTDTDLYDYYQTSPFHIFTLEEYTDLVIDCLELIPEHIVIHRITGDGPAHLLAAPLWSRHKKHVLNTIHHRMKERNAIQGGKKA